MPRLNECLSVTRSADASNLREHILSGHKDGKPFTPYVLTIDLPAPLDRVLDFGCGVGPNFPYLKRIACDVTGFRMAPRVYLLTRLDNDFEPNLPDLMARLGMFEAGDCIHVDHDPVTNQLRVPVRGSFDDVRQLPGGGHCEVLLRSTP